MMVIVHGIRNCDTCRKALSWLAQEGIAHEFHDFRRDGLNEEALAGWVQQVGWEALLNRRGTTWRRLDANVRAGIDAEKAVMLMAATPTLIKRPVCVTGETVLVGFSDGVRAALKS